MAVTYLWIARAEDPAWIPVPSTDWDKNNPVDFETQIIEIGIGTPKTGLEVSVVLHAGADIQTATGLTVGENEDGSASWRLQGCGGEGTSEGASGELSSDLLEPVGGKIIYTFWREDTKFNLLCNGKEVLKDLDIVAIAEKEGVCVRNEYSDRTDVVADYKMKTPFFSIRATNNNRLDRYKPYDMLLGYRVLPRPQKEEIDEGGEGEGNSYSGGEVQACGKTLLLISAFFAIWA